MQRLDGRFVYGATDLNNFLECERLSELSALVARGKLQPPDADDEQLALIRRKGEEHEQRHLEAMQRLHGAEVVCFERTPAGIEAYLAAEAATLAAMRTGARIIYQATFFDGEFIGHADFLRRVDGKPSSLGSWSYEVIDTKLSLLPKPYFLVQLCNYSEHLARLQGTMPEFGYIVLGSGEEQRFRLHDYIAYYRHLKVQFLTFVGEALQEDAAREYPYERKHCAICPWNAACTKQRIEDDHLSLVAWMRRDQLAKLEDGGITTVTQLARASDDDRPRGMNPESFAKLRRQAAVQVRGRESGRPQHELLAPEAAMGFALLPEPAPGDVFFDIEGDPFFEPGRGLEYLFGFWLPGEAPEYHAFWAHDRAQEKERFEEIVDFLIARRRTYPAMHVYHYADYEKAALRRLAQMHCTREDAVDELLRGEVFVDLYAVVRQALVISEERYGLKYVERFYALDRATATKGGSDSIVMFENWLRDRDPALLADIESYNRDDCRSTYLLLQWLLERRLEAIGTFKVELAFRPLKSREKPDEKKLAEERRRSDLERELMDGVLAPQTEIEYRDMHARQRMRYLLANLLAYHRREDKPVWWAYFDRCENVDRLFEFDKEALARLAYCDGVPPFKFKPGDRNLTYTYTFPDQLHKMKPGGAHDPRTKTAGEIVDIIHDENKLLLKRGGTPQEARAVTELIPPGPFATDAQRGALVRVARAFQAGSLERDFPATFDLLANRNPRVQGRARELQPERVSAESVLDVVRALDRSYVFIQGPPGTGKTTIGAQVICELLAAGKRVAVMSTGHKANHHMLQLVEECVAAKGKRFKGLYKHSNGDSNYVSPRKMIVSVDSNDPLEAGGYDLAGGTSWLFARDALVGAFDYLFIDEAGQVALADALAVAPCAENVVLLGDPNQLAQVSLGSHPLHAGDSVLQHLLGDAQTVPPHRGIFLDVSHRMQPQICRFISEAMYEGRLRASADTSAHAILVDGERRAGLEYLAVEHEGNSSRSLEEADRIVCEIARLRHAGVLDRNIMVITPYNAQRNLLRRRFKDAGIAVEVGTVDKFQGQQADVVFYSMAASSGEDIPRSTEFLFERNRFNVAISRAKALSILVCSPRLLDVSCQTPGEMALVNLLCAFVETATARTTMTGTLLR